jgi:hypothetical protein
MDRNFELIPELPEIVGKAQKFPNFPNVIHWMDMGILMLKLGRY